jgi:hypothetical protein
MPVFNTAPLLAQGFSVGVRIIIEAGAASALIARQPISATTAIV